MTLALKGFQAGAELAMRRLRRHAMRRQCWAPSANHQAVWDRLQEVRSTADSASCIATTKVHLHGRHSRRCKTQHLHLFCNSKHSQNLLVYSVSA
jgi:hypothetical protein